MPGLISVGLSHHAASVEIRERLAFDHARWLECAPASLPTVLVSTCNRVEVYAWAEGRPAAGIQRIERALARAAGLAPGDLQAYLVRRRGRDALVHLVRVASGLDSVVVGEEQIRGQIREAVRLANDANRLPPSLRGVFDRVAESARRVRGGTRLGSVPSIASAAIHVAQRTLPTLDGQSAVVLGAGVMAKTAARSLLAAGARVTLLNRTPEHARTVSRTLQGDVVVGSLDDQPSALTNAVLLVSATASRQPIVHVATLRAALAEREYPLLVLDIAVPRDVEPGVRALPNVQLIDMDDLERLCPVDISVRQAELQHAEMLAVAEAERIARWLRLRSASPAIAELRSFGETVRRRELSRSSSRLKDLTPDQIAAVDALTTGIVNKLLHGPTLALRDAATRPSSLSRSRTRILRVLRPKHGRTA
jgi:glutamyl-tRNA reductase